METLNNQSVDMMEEIKAVCGFENRGPCEEGEREAAEYLKSRMNDIGLKAEIEPIKVYPHFYRMGIIAIVLILGWSAATIWSSHAAWIPWVASSVCLYLSIAIWGDVSYRFYIFRRLFPQYPSQNVAGSIPCNEAKKHIFVSGHIDAARVGPHLYDPEMNKKLSKFLMDKLNMSVSPVLPMNIAMFVLTIVCIIRIIVRSGTAMWISTGIFQALASVILLVGLVALLDIETGHVVCGANDNTTAVAACLSIAESIVREPLKNSEFTCLLLGCEEALSPGMAAFIKKHSRELDRENTYFINLESIGGGTIHYTTAEGFVNVTEHDKELVSLARKLKVSGEFPELGTYVVRMGTDAGVPNVRGFKAITLIGLDEYYTPTVYHCDDDNPENIDISTVERGRDLALRMIRELDKG